MGRGSGQGAQHHAFGKVYVNGKSRNETISWFNDMRMEELVSQAQEMVRRYCHGTAEPVPLVLQELHKGTPLEYVSAARVLRPVNQNDQNQHWNQDTPSSSPYDAANSSEKEPNSQPGSERAAPPEGNPESTLMWLNRQLWNGTLEVVRGVVQGVAQGGIHYHAGGGAVGTGRQGDTRAQSIFGDPLPSRDTAMSYGRSGDYRAREGYYNDFGLDKTFGKFTGSADQGNALRRAMHENWGRSQSGYFMITIILIPRDVNMVMEVEYSRKTEVYA